MPKDIGYGKNPMTPEEIQQLLSMLGGDQQMGSLPPVNQFPQTQSGPVDQLMKPPQPISDPQQATGIINEILNPLPSQPMQGMIEQNPALLQAATGQQSLPSSDMTQQMLMSQMNQPAQPEQPVDPLSELLGNRPQREDFQRSGWEKILALALGSLAGLQDPMAGYTAARDYVDRPYADAMQDWQTDLSGLIQQQNQQAQIQQIINEFIMAQQEDETRRRGQDRTFDAAMAGHGVTHEGNVMDRDAALAGVQQRADAATSRDKTLMDIAGIRDSRLEQLNRIRSREADDRLILGLNRNGSTGPGLDDMPGLMREYNRMYGNELFPPDPATGIIGFQPEENDFFGNPVPLDPRVLGAQQEMGHIFQGVLNPRQQQDPFTEEYLRRRGIR